MTGAKEELEILIDETGRVTIHIRGVKGKSCIKQGHDIANVVGEVISQNVTSEYYEPDPKVSITDSRKTHVKE